MVSTLGGALVLGTAMGVISFTGRSIFESGDDKVFSGRLAYKEEAKSRFRRPLNETINELGEGRGERHIHRYASIQLIDSIRYLRTWIRGETEAEDQGKIWLRRSTAIL